MKNTNVRQTIAQRSPRFRARLMAIAISSCFSAAVYAVGVNPNVVAGSATFNQNGNTMTVTNSNGTIINWGALSVLSGEKLIFDQAVNSSVLNRVIGMNVNGKWVVDPTVIAGTISSKGAVWIINSSGIMAKQGAVIDVGRFVASTLNISDANFLAGKFQFDATPGAGAITVESGATIKTSTGGAVYLIGSNVTNNGIITTPEGETILAAGQSVSLVDTGTPGVRVEITGTEGNATNLGTILAEAGRIGMAGALVRNSGTLNASSVVKEGGRVFLKASQDAYVDGDGRIVTTGTKGGSVEVLGNRVTVTDKASIDASGVNGGGTVLVGGDYQGKNPDVQNSNTTYLGKDASIRADATGQGDGGKVILWADDTTRAYGRISARGGVNGGNGGFVETSGHRLLDVDGIYVNTLGYKGNAGKWLLDPTNVCLYASNSAGCTAGTSTIAWSSLNLGTTDATVSTANGFIEIKEGYAYNSARNLSLLSFGDITASGVSVQNSGTGAIDMYAGWTGVGTSVTSGAGNILIDGATIRTGGSMTWKAGSSITIQGNSAYGGAYVGAASQNFEVTDTTAGSIVVQGGSGGTSAVLESSGNQSLTAHIIGVYGGGTFDGSSNNFATIRANGMQQLTLTGAGAALEVTGGGSSSGVASSNNSARIEQTSATGSQTITFTSAGGSITLTGGNDAGDVGAGNNGAKIDGGYGSQTIGSSSVVGPDIALYGGDSGGTFDNSNEASIGLKDGNSGTQTVYAGNISIVGGNADYGNAGFSGAHQRFYLSGNLDMTGGASTQIDKDNIPGSMAYIGNKYGGDVQLNVGGSVNLQGGTGSPVMIGSLFNNANVTISSGSGQNITINSNGAGVFIGSRQKLAPGATDLFSKDVLLGSSTSILSGGNVSITSGGDIALGYVKAALGAGYGASIRARYSILDNNGSGLNVEADSISLRSIYGGMISADTKATNLLSADVAVACEICIAPSGGISIRNWSTSPSAVYLTDRSLSGSISFFNQASLTSATSIYATADNGDLLISTAGNLDLGALSGVAGNSTILAASGNITGSSTSYSAVDSSYADAGLSLVAGGNISLSGSTVTGSQVNLVAGNSVGLTNSTVWATSGGLNAIAPTISLDSSELFAFGNLNLVANNIIAQNQSVLAAGVSNLSALAAFVTNPYADVTMTVTGDIVLNNGVLVESGNDTILNLQGAASTLYLNKTAGLNASKIISDAATGIPATTHVNFLLNPGGGVVIDGVNTTTTTAGGSGFYVLNASTPAAAGAGLDVVYVSAATTGDAGDAAKTTTTTLNQLQKTELLDTTLILKPVASNGTNSGTTGGEDGTFGSEDKKDSRNGNGSEGTDKKEQNNGKSTSKNQCS